MERNGLPQDKPVGTYASRWEIGNDGSVRGKFWMLNAQGMGTEIHFDAASFDDLRIALIQLELVRRQNAPSIVRI